MMTRRSWVLTLLAAVGWLAGSSSVHAGFVIYQSETAESDFIAAIQAGYYLNDFTTLKRETIPSPASFSGGSPGFSYDVSAVGDLWGAPATGTQPYGRAIVANTADLNLVFTFTSGNVNAAGGYFFLTDVNDSLAAGKLTITATAGISGNWIINSPTATWPVRFFGIISDDPISSITLKTNTTGAYSSATHFYAGTTTASAPEPSSLALCGLGVAGLALLRRRSRNRSESNDQDDRGASPSPH